MEVCTIEQQNQVDFLPDMTQENVHPQTGSTVYPNVDYECLRKYDENNDRFSMATIVEHREGDHQHRAIGYNCVYRHGKHQIKLEYHFEDATWKETPLESSDGEETLFDHLFPSDDFHIRSLFQSLTLEQQIQIIVKRYDKHFAEIDKIQTERNCESQETSLSAPIITADARKKPMNCDFIELRRFNDYQSTENYKDTDPLRSLDDFEKDFADYGLHSLITGSRSKFHHLAPPPVAPRRSRQNSAFSQCSVRYASFIPPPTAPVRQRRVIESIIINVKRKKKLFEKIVDLLKRTETTLMYELGLEFLRVFDGKFNYRVGHEFEMTFQKKTWVLTIEQIKCVDCPAGEVGPRSLLILCCKGRYTTVQV